ncbi:MAG: biotin transporter BioY [Planctomycetota bacterium]
MSAERCSPTPARTETGSTPRALVDQLWLQRPRWRRPALVAVGVMLTAIGARVAMPMHPVPTTLQTLALFTFAAATGPRLGMATAVLYGALGLCGVPILAEGRALTPAEWATSPSVGYILGFVPAAAVAGVAVRARGLRALVRACLWLFAAHLIVLAVGTLGLCRLMEPPAAVEAGFAPFVWAAGAKSAAGAVLLALRGGARSVPPVRR